MTVVSATDTNDQIASFSTYGSFVTIAAPGNMILTTSQGGIYQYWWGTSFATPVAAATAALVLSKRPDFTPSQVDSILVSTASDLGTAGKDIYYGSGRINAAAALQVAAGSSPTADTTPPTVSIASPTGGTVSGTVAVSVNASDNVGVTRVDLRVNGSTVASTNAAPYQFSWNSASAPDGMVSMTAMAFDAAGNSTTSSAVSLNVQNAASGGSDTTPPVVTITSPASGATVSGTVAIRTAAADNSGAAGITQKLYIDGMLKTTATGGNLSYSWNMRKSSAGAHTIAVTATDAAGNAVTAQLQVTVRLK